MGLLAVLWRWRWELGCVVLAVGVETFSYTLGRRWAPLVAPACALILLLDRTSRAAFLRRARAVMSQHRLRAAFAATGVRSASGRAPMIVWTTITQTGERIWLWCPIGIDRAVLEPLAGTLAAACWAKQVQVGRHTRHAQLVALEITRDVRAISLPEATTLAITCYETIEIPCTAAVSSAPGEDDAVRRP